MMKRVLVALLLLALALSLSVTSYLLLQNCIGKMGQALENAVYTDLPVKESSAQIEACAAKNLRTMRVLSLHAELDALTQQLERLPLLLNDPAQYRQTCLFCLRLLREFADGQRITLETIL